MLQELLAASVVPELPPSAGQLIEHENAGYWGYRGCTAKVLTDYPGAQYFSNGIGNHRFCARAVFPAALVSEVWRYPELSSAARNFDFGLPKEIRVRIDGRFFVNPNVRRLPPNWLSRFSVEDLDGDRYCGCFLSAEGKWVVTAQHGDSYETLHRSIIGEHLNGAEMTDVTRTGLRPLFASGWGFWLKSGF